MWLVMFLILFPGWKDVSGLTLRHHFSPKHVTLMRKLLNFSRSRFHHQLSEGIEGENFLIDFLLLNLYKMCELIFLE